MTEPVVQRPQTLWENLREAGHVSGDYPRPGCAIGLVYQAAAGQFRLACRAFSAGLFALGLEDLLRNETVALIIGMLLLVGAWLLLRAQAAECVRQSSGIGDEPLPDRR
ncbi:MAG: hypothetical protein R3F38_13995 [Gammaproteobacteria bacterium]